MADCKIIIIGAGLAGLRMAAQLKCPLNKDGFEIYENLDDVGRTWAQNVYPNLNCDNPDWTSKVASQPDILAYIHRCVSHHDPEHRIRLQQESASLHWSDKDSLWTASFVDLVHGRKYDRKARYIITALGVLNVPKGLDEPPMLRSFKGTIFFISWIMNERSPKSLARIVRSEQLVAPKGDFKHGKAFRCFSAMCRWLCNSIASRRRTDLTGAFVHFAPTISAQKLEKQIPMPFEFPLRVIILIPLYDFGAKHAVVDYEYLEVTNRKNFTLVKCNEIRGVEDDGRTVVDGAGNPHNVDTIIMANDFKTQDLLTPMIICGKDGKGLREQWRTVGGAQAYMEVSVSGFPNPLKRLGRYEKRECVSIMPEGHTEQEFNQKIQHQLQGLVYTKTVNTWYINPETGENTLIWPGSQMGFWWSRCIKWIQWKDWKIE